MHNAKLVMHLFLAAASLHAAAHRPAPHKQHLATSKPHAATSKRRKPDSKAHRTAKKHQLEKPYSLSVRPPGKHPVASKHHPIKPVATAQHHSGKHHGQLQQTGKTYTVTATVYQAVASQTDNKPFLTADNSRIRPHYGSKVRWLALSRDLLAQGGGKFQYGDKVHVGNVSPQLDGVYTVHDTMNRRYRHHIDILTHASEKLHLCDADAQLRLAAAPVPRKSQARASARPGRGA